MSLHKTFELEVASEKAMLSFGARLAALVMPGITIYLRGDLGAGKTTFCRGFLAAFGHKGNAKSPTYTLVEPYDFTDLSIYHFDLYRLSDPSELEYIGWRDYFNQTSICLVEWPEMGEEILPKPDIELCIDTRGRLRRVVCSAVSDKAVSIINRL
jgi:tRNA threonylcarbamoyladenosine biosynthesis protein TsaE